MFMKKKPDRKKKKNLSKLVRGTMSENSGGYYCVNNCLHSFKSTNKLELHEDVIKDHEYYHIKMSEEHKKHLDV